jgi:hypothetical protein
VGARFAVERVHGSRYNTVGWCMGVVLPHDCGEEGGLGETVE